MARMNIDRTAQRVRHHLEPVVSEQLIAPVLGGRPTEQPGRATGSQTPSH